MNSTKFPTDIEIAQKANIQHINKIAQKLDIDVDLLEHYGKYKAKLPLSLIKEKPEQGKLVLVTAINPTPAGEGKTTVSVGLTDGLCSLGKKSMAVLREPSLGPVFGIKGGAAGGGYSQVIPMVDINLHFTGDFNAIEKAHNLLSAAIDNNLQSRKRSIGLDPRAISWKRVMDMNDRALRNIVVGLGGKGNGMPREDGFDITPASEIMAILCLSENFDDLKERLGNIYIGDKMDRTPAFARELNVVGAMAILLKDAIQPNLVQTLEGNPVLLHGGPFASIAQGTNSIIATKMGLSMADYVVTEAGFGADLGAEKFMDIKCVAGDLQPDAVVIVTTVKALRYHGGAARDAYNDPDTSRVLKGVVNLEKHIENIKKYGLTPVVAINRFHNDTEEELECIKNICRSHGVEAVLTEGFSKGGLGTQELAQSVLVALDAEHTFKPLYDWSEDIKTKISKVACTIYGAAQVKYSTKAERQIRQFTKRGFDKFPVCIVKTPASLSDNAKLIGRPSDFTVTVREFEVAAGARFIIPIMGDMLRMPGLPSVPAAEGMDIDSDGNITGLS